MRKTDLQALQNSDPLLSILVPTCNDAHRIVATLGALTSFLKGLGLPWEIIVCDEESTDETVDIAACLDIENLVVLRVPKSTERDDTVRHGLLVSRGLYVLAADAGWGLVSNRYPRSLSELQPVVWGDLPEPAEISVRTYKSDLHGVADQFHPAM